LTNAINAKEDALTQLNSLDADASSLNDELNDFTLDSYIKYDDNINLYGPIGIGAGIILPILFMAVLWPLNQRKIIPSCPATTSIVFSIMAFVFLWILSTAFIPAIVAYSDACNSIDTVVKRISNEDSLRYYIDCDPTTQTVFGEFQTKLTTATDEATNARNLLQTLNENGVCTGLLTDLVTDVDAVIALIENDATDLLSCSRLQTIYTTSKGIVCGDETYTLVLHLHQAFIGKRRKSHRGIAGANMRQTRRVCINSLLLDISYCDKTIRVQPSPRREGSISLIFKKVQYAVCVVEGCNKFENVRGCFFHVLVNIKDVAGQMLGPGRVCLDDLLRTVLRKALPSWQRKSWATRE